jgi:hypothetical protein
MGGKAALICGFLLGGLLALAAGSACAQGGRFGGGGFPGFHFGGPRFDGPRFDGPRFDGPRPHEPINRDDFAPLAHQPAGPPPPHMPASPREPASSIEPAGPPPQEPLAPPPPEFARTRKCFSSAESRARVAQFGLRPPFEMMRRASILADAQALGGKLCRWADLDVYDISLLRPDGRVVHVFIDASTGREVSAPKMQ